MVLTEIKINNFGPIKKGFSKNDGYFRIAPVTIFCGNQATGKSTIAKLYSTCTWIEKAVCRGDYNIAEFTEDTFISICKKQKINNYFQTETYIHFKGQKYSLEYKIQKFSITKIKTDTEYCRPKIMYVPSERNLFTVFNTSKMSLSEENLMLRVLQDEYINAAKKLALDGFQLPVGSNVFLLYDPVSFTFYIENREENYKIKISESSSGIQSITPLILVSEYLSDNLKSEELNLTPSQKQFFENNVSKEIYEVKNIEPQKNSVNSGLGQALVGGTLGALIGALLSNSKEKSNEPNFDELLGAGIGAVLGAGLGYLVGNGLNDKQRTNILKKEIAPFYNSCFINIVEEPEQNLYPQSQSAVLYALLKIVNENENNRLVITTHSPYLLSYLTLAAKAAELKKNKIPVEDLDTIIPSNSVVESSRIIIYETKEDGSIYEVVQYNNLPSDDNALNVAMEQTNEDFARLLELEQKHCQ